MRYFGFLRACRQPFLLACLAASFVAWTGGCGKENGAITSSTSRFEVDEEGSAPSSSPASGERAVAPPSGSPSPADSLADSRPPSPAPRSTSPAQPAAPAPRTTPAPNGAAPVQPPSIPLTELDDLAVPEGTPEELWQFIENLARRQPQGRTEQDFFRNLQEIMGAQITAAEKILEHPEASKEMRQRSVEVKLRTLQELMSFGVPEAEQHFEQFGRALVNDEDEELAKFGRMLTFSLDVNELVERNTGSADDIVAKATKLLEEEAHDNETFQYVRAAALELLQAGHPSQGQQIVTKLLEAFEGVTEGQLPQQVAALPEEAYFLQLELPQKLTAFVQQEPASLEPLQEATRQLLAQPRAGVTTLQQVLFIADAMERSGEIGAAEDVFVRIAEVFGSSEDEEISRLAKEATDSAATRFGIVGNPISLSGKLQDGTELNWDELREGKVVLVTYWSIENQRFVQQEAARLRELMDQFGERGFRVVGINVDEEPQLIDQFFRFQSFPWPNVLDGTAGGGQLVKQYGVATIPFSILLNREGQVVAIHVNSQTLPEKLPDLLN